MPCMVISSRRLWPGACPFSWQEGASAGRQVRKGVATGLRCAGMEVMVFGIELTSVGLLFDDGETGDAEKRVGLHSESGMGNLMIAAGTDSVRTCVQGREHLFDPAKLFDGGSFTGKAIWLSC